MTNVNLQVVTNCAALSIYGGRARLPPGATEDEDEMTQPPADTGSRNWTVTEKLLTVLAAILALGTAFLGYQTAMVTQAKEQAQAVAANKNTDLSSLQGQFDQLKSQNDKLESENTQLRSKLGLPGPTAGPQPPTGASVRHAGQIVLSASGEGADLDSPQSDPQWRGDGSQADLGYDGSKLDFAYYGFVLYLGTTKADYETCHDRTGYSNGYAATIDSGSIQLGDYLCLKTGEHRYSAVRLTQLAPSKATFDVVTYDPPES